MGLPWDASHARARALAIALIITLVLAVREAALAHKPLFADRSASDPNAAVRILDPTVSHVIYFELDERSPVQWFVIENDKPRAIPIQVGVPIGRARASAEPAVMLFRSKPSERLDPHDLKPDEIDGTFELQSAGHPTRFYEPVTGTESLILVDTQVSLPEAGSYYGAVYHAPGEAGRVWVAVGRREGFSWRDIVRLPGWIHRVREFHDVPGLPRWVWIAGAVLTTAVAALIWALRRRRNAP